MTRHNCINRRLPTHGALYGWEFEKGGRKLNVRVDGQLVVSNASLIPAASLAGFGLAYLPEDIVSRRWATFAGTGGRCLPFPGCHLYYPSRRQQASAFAVVLDALRYRERLPAQKTR